MGWLEGYTYRRAIYANTSSLTETLTDVPLPIFPASVSGKAQADLDDCVITAADGVTVLDYYWETKSVTAPVGHFKIPSLAHGVTGLHVGYLYFGSPSAVDRSNEEGVFTSCAARWDLAEASGTIYDSTANNHDGTGTDLSFAATGKVGSGITCNGTTSLIDCGADWIGTGADSFSAWIYPTGWGGGGAGRVVINGKLDTALTSGQMAFSSVASGYIASASSSLSLSSWFHIAVSRNAVGVANLYVNGVLSGTANRDSGTPAAGTTNVIIGNRAAGDRTFAGTLDEIRHYESVKPASWFLAEYMAGANTLFSFTADEIAGVVISNVIVKPPKGYRLPNDASGLRNGLEAAYLFNGTPGDALLEDCSGKGRHGTIVGATWVNTERGPALRFASAPKDNASATVPTSFPNGVSLSVLYAGTYPASTEYPAGLYRAGGYLVLFGRASATSFGVYVTDSTTTVQSATWANTPPAGTWTFMTGTVDSSDWKVRLYINGILRDKSDGALVGGMYPGDGSLHLGTYAASVGSLNGDVAFAALHSRALDAAEVAQLHNDMIAITR